MSRDRQTANVLILELATMVVAISLAFTSTFISTFDLRSMLVFIFITIVVIWFWWDYVMDRLAFPPRTSRFPLLDILVLILISLIPFAIRQDEIYYLSGVLGALIIVWALLIRDIIKENRDLIEQRKKCEMDEEVKQRLVVGVAFILTTVLSIFYSFIGVEVFIFLVILIIAWNFLSRRRGAQLCPEAMEKGSAVSPP